MKFLPLLLSLSASVNVTDIVADGDGLLQQLATEYVFTVQVVDFDKCNFKLTKNEFYRGIISSFSLITGYGVSPFPPHVTQQTKILVNELTVTQGDKTSRYNGPAKSNSTVKKQDWYSWHWLDIFEDVRKSGPALKLGMLAGMGNVYIPLLHPEDSGLRDGKAFMLQIAPDPQILDGLKKPWKIRTDVLWFDERDANTHYLQSHGRYEMSMYLSEILDTINSYLPDLRDGLHGRAFYSKYLAIGYEYGSKPNTNNKPITSDINGNLTDELCSVSDPKKVMDFNTFHNLLRTVMPWIH